MVLSLDDPATRPFFDTLGDLLAVARLLARAYESEKSSRGKRIQPIGEANAG